MSIKPIGGLFRTALDQGYALGYFESWNLESLQGVLDAAEETRSPVIIGFNGEFLTHPERLVRERIMLYGVLAKAAAEAASVPCGLIFNECSSDKSLREAVDAGFNLVMLADPEASYEVYEQRVKELVGYAHRRGVAVEAEIGELPKGVSGVVSTEHSSLTDPDLAARFVSSTGIDLLSVSVGNVHVLTDGTRNLDLELLAVIHERTNAPLGLHGGTGIDAYSIKEATRLGVVKIAYGTYLKQRYLQAVRRALGKPETDPHKILGMGGSEDALVSGRLAVRDAVLERIDLLGCCGKA
jgi:ketose-bisphosphate aldolase